MTRNTFLISLAFAASACAAEGDLSLVARVFDGQLASVEKQVVSLAEAMPAERYSFAPAKGAFSGVRTFGLQVTHIATVNFEVAAALLGEANPEDMGKDQNGPSNLKSKDDIVDYLKRSFAYTHKALRTVNPENLTEQIQSAFSTSKVPRLSMVTVPQWHSFDHYGQMVVYARMCGVVPPASRPQ